MIFISDTWRSRKIRRIEIVSTKTENFYCLWLGDLCGKNYHLNVYSSIIYNSIFATFVKYYKVKGEMRKVQFFHRIFKKINRFKFQTIFNSFLKNPYLIEILTRFVEKHERDEKLLGMAWFAKKHVFRHYCC